MPKTQRRLVLNGITTYYEDAGPLDAEHTLIIVHGWTASRVLWRTLQRTFAESMRVVIYDLRGHGDAGKPEGADYTIQAFADDLSALLDALQLEQVFLLGHSMGGLVCQSFTAAHAGRVRGLVLSGTSLGVGDTSAPEAQDMLDMLRDGGYADFIAFGAEMWFAGDVDQKIVEASKAAMQHCPEHVALAAMEGLLGYTSRDVAASITPPALVIGGSDDALQANDEFAALASALPNASLQLIDGVGHDAYLEAPEDYGRAVLTFLREIESPTL